MATPVIREVVGGGNTGSVSATTTVTTSGNVKAGDLLVCFLGVDWGTADQINVPTGTAGTWTERTVDNRTTGTSHAHLKTFTRPVAVAGAQTVTVSSAATDTDTVVTVVVVDGTTIDPADWLDGAAGGGSGTALSSAASTAHVAPSVSPSTADAVLLCGFVAASGSPPTYTTPTGMTAVDTRASGYARLSVFRQTLTATGATGTRTATASVARLAATASIALRGITQTAPPTSAVLWDANEAAGDCVAGGFENDSYQRQANDGAYNNAGVPWPIPYEAMPSWMGSGRGLRFALPDNWRRYEVKPHPGIEGDEGDDLFFGFAFGLEAGFPINATAYQIVNQWHGADSLSSPPVAIEVKQGQIRMSGGHGKPGASPASQYAYDRLLMNGLATGVRYNVVTRLKFSAVSANCLVQVWINGTLVEPGFSPPGAMVYPNDDGVLSPSYNKAGIYHSSTIGTGGTVWQTGHKLGTSYAAVDPTPAAPSTSLGALADTFSGTALDAGWIANGAGVSAGSAYVNCSHTGGNPAYSSLRRSEGRSFSGATVTFYDVVMPGPAGDNANGQLWVMDPAPADTVDRAGFELRVAQNELDCQMQTGATYAPVGTATVLPYDPVAHRHLRITHTGTSLVWATSPDGLTWTTQRTVTTVPAWANKTSLVPSWEGFRFGGVNDTLRVGSVNVAPAALPSSAPVGQDALQRRTLAELRSWRSWLAANGATGWVGEFNGVTLATKYGDTVQGAKWDALLETYLAELDVDAMHGTVWASGREWGQGYPLGVHVGTNVGDPLTIANAGASAVIAGHPSRAGRWHGVNLSGWEQGITINGGGTVRSGAGYVHTAADFAFLAANGVDTVRLPFAWERVQPTLGAALSTSALTTLDGMLTAARQYGIRVVLDLHNYGRYTQENGTTVVALGGGISNAQLSDLWTRLSTWVRASTSRSQTVVAYDLMNEPWGLTGGAATWEAASQAAVTAIRGGGDTRLLLVEGYTFASLTEWATWHPDGWISDPQNNFTYSAHHYWDTTSALGARSGTYQQSPTGPITTYAIELQAAETAEAGTELPPVPDRVNLAVNPSLETNAAGHTIAARRGSSTTLAPAVGSPAGRSSTITAAAGTYYGFVNVTGPGTTSTTPDATISLPSFPVTAGLQYSVGVARCVSNVTNTPTDRIALVWKDGNGAQVGSPSLLTAAGIPTTWTRRGIVQATAPAGAVECEPQLHYFAPADTTLRSYRWDALLYEQHDESALRSYFDGSSPGASWNGVQHASTSRISGVTTSTGDAAGAAGTGGSATAQWVAYPTASGKAPTASVVDPVRTTPGTTTPGSAATSGSADPIALHLTNYASGAAPATADPVYYAQFGTAAATAVTGGAAEGWATATGLTARGDTVTDGSADGVRLPADYGIATAVTTGTATARQTLTDVTATGAAPTSAAVTAHRDQPATATGAAPTAGSAHGQRQFSADATGTAAASGSASGVRVTAATASGAAVTQAGVAEGGALLAFATGTARTVGVADGVVTALPTATGRAVASGSTGVVGTASAVTRTRGTALANRGHGMTAAGAATTGGSAGGVRVVAATATGAAATGAVTGGVIAITVEASGTARARGVVTSVVSWTPVFIRPAGPAKPQTPLPVTRLLVADTRTGKVHFELPYTALSWNSPLNGIGAATATLPVEATLDQLDAQGANDPRSALREVITGPFRFSLVVAYGNVAVWGGPYTTMPTEEAGGTIQIGAAQMERMLELRQLVRIGSAVGATGAWTDPTRDITVNNTNVRNALYQIVRIAMETHSNQGPRELPIVASATPDTRGDENFTWKSYDLLAAWKVVTELAGRDDGPDFRLEPRLVERSNGLYAEWDLQIGDPYLPASGNLGADGPMPWTWDDLTSRIARSYDSTGLASVYYSTGDGQDRDKKIARAQSSILPDLGFPALERVDTGGQSETDQDKLARRNRGLLAAHSMPTDSWKATVDARGDPDVGQVRRGDVARLDVFKHLLIERGTYLRRITDIAGDESDYVTLTCDHEDDLAGVS